MLSVSLLVLPTTLARPFGILKMINTCPLTSTDACTLQSQNCCLRQLILISASENYPFKVRFVNRKAFVLAGVFLAVALIVPPVLLITQSDADLDNLVNQGANLADETTAQGVLADIDSHNQVVFGAAIAVEAISVVLFLVCLWFALKP